MKLDEILENKSKKELADDILSMYMADLESLYKQGIENKFISPKVFFMLNLCYKYWNIPMIPEINGKTVGYLK